MRIDLTPAGIVLASGDASETVSLADAPDLVEALLRRGDWVTARSVAAAWLGGLANKYGHENVTLGP